MPRRRTLTIAALALLLAAAPFLPDSGHEQGALTPSGSSGTAAATPPAGSGAVGTARITPQMQAEIDRVVAEGLARPALRGRPGPEALVAQQARCAVFEGLTYCLHTGWTEDSPAQVQARLDAAARAAQTRTSPVESTGDLDLLAQLDQTARLAPTARAAAERDELTRAAQAVAKVWMIRHEIEGVPYPPGFLQRHPEARPAPGLQPVAAYRAGSASPSGSASPTGTKSGSASPSATASAKPKTAADYPEKDKILDPEQTAEQTRSYWCGPTSMQMIAWGWYGKDGGQDKWAKRLGTTTSGTDIGALVKVINDATGWDRRKYAGPYITLDVGKWSYDKWYLLIMRHIHDYRAPIVLHPILLKKYYPYLDDDASGHYQVGRGYAKRGDKPDLIGYFEPWNQQRFDPSEPFIERVQWQRAYRSFRANKAHPYHNIGV